ncbi:uncharacterized protein LOC113587931 [Electrophorus electricus]|uniref:uncharacterized protein LOC113587931 n=1 Tax=Electrophorus electricus TaxID=8005 RepID=UPI0015CFAD2B|nr:uncharacterized protein LOC113587931 [Electrophorus electricus]
MSKISQFHSLIGLPCFLIRVKLCVIFGVLVMFTGAAMGAVPAIYRFNQNLTCYGTLGETLHLELVPEDEIILNNNTSIILKYKKQNITTNRLDQPRWQFIADNRTIIITRTEKKDSGRYTLDTFDAKGTIKGKYHLQLNIEAAVSSVVVKDNCFSSERRTVSCSSEGDQLHFNWTLSGTRITHLLDDGIKTLLLEKEYDGNVTCHVKNNVSHGQSSILLHQCPGTSTADPTTAVNVTSPSIGISLPVTYNKTLTPTQNPNSGIYVPHIYLKLILIILGTFSVLLIILSIIVFLVYKKKQRSRKNTSSSQNGEELLYAKVTHIPNNGTKRTGRTTLASEENVEYAVVIGRDNQKIADEVQYGEVVFNKQGVHAREQANVQEECTYSHVQYDC